MFIIKWRTTRHPAHWPFAKWFYGLRWMVRTGLGRYATREAAQARVEEWQRLFPYNSYYVEPVS